MGKLQEYMTMGGLCEGSWHIWWRVEKESVRWGVERA